MKLDLLRPEQKLSLEQLLSYRGPFCVQLPQIYRKEVYAKYGIFPDLTYFPRSFRFTADDEQELRRALRYGDMDPVLTLGHVGAKYHIRQTPLRIVGSEGARPYTFCAGDLYRVSAENQATLGHLIAAIPLVPATLSVPVSLYGEAAE